MPYTFNPFTGTLDYYQTGSGTPGGSDTQVQYNNAGAFGGFGMWDGTALYITGTGNTYQSSIGTLGARIPTEAVYNLELYNDAAGATPTLGFWGVYIDDSVGGLNFGWGANSNAIRMESGSLTVEGSLKLIGAGHNTVTVSPPATGTWTLTLPTTDGNSGEFLQTDGSGVTTWAAGNSGTVTSVGLSGTANQITVTGSTPITSSGSWTLSIPSSAQLSIAKLTNLTTNGFVKTSGSDGTLSIDTSTYLSTLTVGSTTITSGTTTRILYDNAGVLGEYTLTGTGTVVAMQTDPALLNTATVTRTSIGTTTADGLILTNTTAAAAGAQQYSPRLRFTGQGWKTNATAASQTVDWIVENQPIQSTTNPKTALAFLSQINGGGYVSQIEVRPFGNAGTSAWELYLNNAGTLRTIIRSGGIGSSIWFNAQNVDGRVSLATDYGGQVQTTSIGYFGWGNSSTNASSGFNAGFYCPGAAIIQMGVDVNGAAVAQTFQACNGITGTNKTGADFTIQSGKGTGAGAVSSLIFKTPAILASGTTTQTQATRLTITEGSITQSTGTNLIGGANYHQMTEMTAPTAGAANTVRIYAEDNGAGKTRLMALFNSGAAQQIAIEP